jgi:S-adenosylmethionine decarboxylase
MVRVVIIVFVLFGKFLFSEEHLFKGKHFFASYLECDLKAIGNLDALIQAMDDAVRLSGATILERTHYVFPPNGLTIAYLLSESHATLHTYPEYGCCFVDLFTCGDHCSSHKFDEALRTYLQPGRVDARLFLRTESVQELPFQENR